MTASTNGRTPAENLKHLRSKPVFETKAEIPLTKCLAHPTKRMWTDPMEAVREAEVRSQIAPVPIAAYRCDSCGNAHLCKASAVRAGTLLERPTEPERNWEVFPNPKPGNHAAIRKGVVALLEGRTEISSREIKETLGISQNTVMVHMRQLGWKNGTGRSAKWTPKPGTLVTEPHLRPVPTPLQVEKAQAFAGAERKELEASVARHPASQLNSWRNLEMDRVRHVPLGDLVDVLSAAGVELRIQTRGER